MFPQGSNAAGSYAKSFRQPPHLPAECDMRGKGAKTQQSKQVWFSGEKSNLLYHHVALISCFLRLKI